MPPYTCALHAYLAKFLRGCWLAELSLLLAACRTTAFTMATAGNIVLAGQPTRHNYTKVVCPETGSPTCVTRRCGDRVRKTGNGCTIERARDAFIGPVTNVSDLIAPHLSRSMRLEYYYRRALVPSNIEKQMHRETGTATAIALGWTVSKDCLNLI